MKFPHLRQNSSMACGTTSLAIILKYYGYGNLKQLLDEESELSRSGTSLFNISQLAKSYHLNPQGYELSVSELQEVQLPCILHFESNHFVVLHKINKSAFYISDPAIGKYKLNRKAFLDKWNGIILELTPTESFSGQALETDLEHFRKNYKSLKFAPFIEYAKSKKKLFFSLFALSFSIKILYLIIPLLIKFIFDYGISLGIEGLAFLFLFTLLTVGLIAVGFYSRDKLFSQIKFSFEHFYFSSLFDHLIRLKQRYFDRYKKEDIINRFGENNRLRSLLSSSLLDSFFNSVFLFIYLLILFVLSTEVFVVAFITVLVNLALILYTSPIIINNENLIFHEKNKVLNIFLDGFLGLKNVKPLTAEGYFSSKWDNMYKSSLLNIFNSEELVIGQRVYIIATSLVSRIIVLFSSILLIQTGSISFGDFIAVNAIYYMALGSVSQVVLLRNRLIKIDHSLERVTDFFIKKIEESNDEQTQSKRIDIQSITISDLYFSYDSEAEILKGVNVTFYKGKKYGVVGKNGSGKTTLIKLIIQLYDHYEGNIYLNDEPINKIKKKTLRKNIFYFPSEVYLFDVSIRNNMLVANPEASDNEIYQALELAGLKNMVDEFYLGLNHRVGDRGMKLSTGQKLRFGFARLFLSNPSVIILDEATSSLDPDAEKVLLSNTYQQFKDTMIISVAHRIHALKKFDEILVIDDGQLAECGNHNQLMKQKGLYENFVLQST